MKIATLVLMVSCGVVTQGFAQDSVRVQAQGCNSIKPLGLFAPRSLLVQFLTGEISYAIPFWTVCYPRLQKDRGQFSNFPDPIMALGFGAAIIGVPLGTHLTLNLLDWKTGNGRAAFVGSLIGPLIARLSIASDKVFTPILFSGVASVLTSMLFNDLFSSE